MFAVNAGGVDVIGRIDRGGCGCFGFRDHRIVDLFAVKHGFDRSEAQWDVGDANCAGMSP